MSKKKQNTLTSLNKEEVKKDRQEVKMQLVKVSKSKRKLTPQQEASLHFSKTVLMSTGYFLKGALHCFAQMTQLFMEAGAEGKQNKLKSSSKPSPKKQLPSKSHQHDK